MASSLSSASASASASNLPGEEQAAASETAVNTNVVTMTESYAKMQKYPVMEEIEEMESF